MPRGQRLVPTRDDVKVIVEDLSVSPARNLCTRESNDIPGVVRASDEISEYVHGAMTGEPSGSPTFEDTPLEHSSRCTGYGHLCPEDVLGLIFSAGFQADDPEWMEGFERLCLRAGHGTESISDTSFVHFLMEDLAQRCLHKSERLQEKLDIGDDLADIICFLMEDLTQRCQQIGDCLQEMLRMTRKMSDGHAEHINSASFVRLLIEDLTQRCRHTGVSLREIVEAEVDSAERSSSASFARLLMEDLARRFQSTSDSFKEMLQVTQKAAAPCHPLPELTSKIWIATATEDPYVDILDNDAEIAWDDAGDSSKCSTGAPSTPREGSSCSDYESLSGSRPSSVSGVRADAATRIGQLVALSALDNDTVPTQAGQADTVSSHSPASSSRNSISITSIASSSVDSEIFESQVVPGFLGRRKQINRRGRDFFQWNFRRSSRTQQRFETIESEEEEVSDEKEEA